MNKPPFGGFFIPNEIKQINRYQLKIKVPKPMKVLNPTKKELNRNYLISF